MDDDHIKGIYPFFILKSMLFGTFGVSLPFVGYGGIISDDKDAENELLKVAGSLMQKKSCKSIELRQRHPLESSLPSHEHKVTSVLSLAGRVDESFGRLHTNVRNKIRKARKNNVRVEAGIDQVSKFYAIYAKNLRDLGTPVISKKFFLSIVMTFPENSQIYCAVHDGKVIAAKLVLFDNHTCYFVWSASERDALRYAPVHAMNWAAIEDACHRGVQFVDFGRSTAGSTHEAFKKYWGGEMQTLPWCYQLTAEGEMPGLNKENESFSLAIRLWKKMPLCVSKIVGPPIARNLP
jgi:FemAB-related protein (PEP-CTERM system-associated)